MKQRMIKPRIRLASFYQADSFNKIWVCNGGGYARCGRSPFDAYRQWEYDILDKRAYIPSNF